MTQQDVHMNECPHQSRVFSFTVKVPQVSASFLVKDTDTEDNASLFELS